MALVRSFQLLVPLVAPRCVPIQQSLAGNVGATVLSEVGSIVGGAWSTLSARTVIRNQFPRARETKRVRVHGWWKRMATAEGRRLLMRRILKGRHSISH
ncbi:39S ribosomal protein L34, mitochondrial [Culex pipiens pallens]|uniref:39S ribosomal protein L34, mitochondrial n=1 Tax=Culex pipiens pallens TaxID=42434 RepID=UPI001952BF1E|nr:39S ribosomal protein L34, mitochondrial [Culex pipiens pallens]